MVRFRRLGINLKYFYQTLKISDYIQENENINHNKSCISNEKRTSQEYLYSL